MTYALRTTTNHGLPQGNCRHVRGVLVQQPLGLKRQGRDSTAARGRWRRRGWRC